MPQALHEKTAAELGAALEAGEPSSVEVAQAFIDRVQAVDEQVHAFLHCDEEDFLVFEATRCYYFLKGFGARFGKIEFFDDFDLPTGAFDRQRRIES